MSRAFLALAVSLAILGGCSAPRYGEDQFRAELQAPYQLAAGDRLRVLVFGQESLSNSYAVDGAGNISMPLIGLVRVHGLTRSRRRRPVEARLRQGYLREPRVSVEVEAFGPSSCSGEVGASGQYPYRQRDDGAERDRDRRRLRPARRKGQRRSHAHRRRAGHDGVGSPDFSSAARRYNNCSRTILLK